MGEDIILHQPLFDYQRDGTDIRNCFNVMKPMNSKKNFFNRGLYTTSGEDDLILHQPLFDYQRDGTDIRNFKLSTYYEIKRTGIRD